MDLVIQLALISMVLLLVFVNGLFVFVASELSIVKVREIRIQELVQQGNRSADGARALVRNMDEYLSATQLGITIASLAPGLDRRTRLRLPF